MSGHFQKNYLIRLAGLIFCIVAFVVLPILLWESQIENFLESSVTFFKRSIKFLDDLPLIFYTIAIIILPLFFLPCTPIYFLASSRVGEDNFIYVVLFCLAGVFINMAIAYFVSRYFGKIVRKYLENRKTKIPKLLNFKDYEIVLLVRMVPGNPLAVQNYLLGLFNIPFATYMLVSILIQIVQVPVYVYLGDAVFSAKASQITLAVSLVLILAIFARMLKRAYKKGENENVISKEQ